MGDEDLGIERGGTVSFGGGAGGVSLGELKCAPGASCSQVTSDFSNKWGREMGNGLMVFCQ